MGSLKNQRQPHKASFKASRKVRVQQMQIAKKLQQLKDLPASAVREASTKTVQVPSHLSKWYSWRLILSVFTEGAGDATGTAPAEMDSGEAEGEPKELGMLAKLAANSSPFQMDGVNPSDSTSGKDKMVPPGTRRSERNAAKLIRVPSIWLRTPNLKRKKSTHSHSRPQQQKWVTTQDNLHFVETPPLLMKESTIPGAGLGVVAMRAIRKGDIVSEYGGELLSQGEAAKRKVLLQHHHMRTVLNMGAYVIDGKPHADGYFSLEKMALRSHVGAMINDARNSSGTPNVE
jgi:hypothetical protein